MTELRCRAADSGRFRRLATPPSIAAASGKDAELSLRRSFRSDEHGRALSIRAMNPENMVGQIQPDGDVRFHGTVPLWRSNNDHVLAL